MAVFIGAIKKDPCWRGYEMIGTKRKGKRIVPNCVRIGATQLTEKEQLTKMLESYKRADDKVQYDQFRDLINPQQQSAASRLFIKAYQYAESIGMSRDEFRRFQNTLFNKEYLNR
jgi:hypothetical protein